MAYGSALMSAALLLALFSSASVQAQQTPAQSQPGSQPSGGDKPAVVFADVVSTQATVTDVNKSDRTVTLQTEDGRELTVEAGPEVKNFDQIEKGDKVTAEYHEATAIVVRTPDAAGGSSAAPVTQYNEAEVAPPGQKPAGVVTEVTEIVATVEDIDYDKREMTLKGPRGNTRTVGLGEEVQNPQAIKKGDEVVVRYTEEVAVAVTK